MRIPKSVGRIAEFLLQVASTGFRYSCQNTVQGDCSQAVSESAVAVGPALIPMNRHFATAHVIALVLICATLVGTIAGSPLRSSAGPDIISSQLNFDGTTYQYYLFCPPSKRANRPRPLLFLVHGAGANGRDFVRLWYEFALRNDIALLAPTLRLGEDLEKQVAGLFIAFVEDAKAKCQVDSERVYLFGYSAGGYSTFDAATLDSTYFAAATVLAGVITPDYDWILGRAQRKTPIAIYIGDRDEYFSLALAQRTRNALLKKGFTVHYVEIPQQHHNYGANFAWVQRDSWDFMSSFALSPKSDSAGSKGK
jgi:predicted esterase